MSFKIDTGSKTISDELSIILDKSITTLEAIFYINNLCVSYSKIICLNEICSYLLCKDKVEFGIIKYDIGGAIKKDYLNRAYMHLPIKKDVWFSMDDYVDISNFFSLFNKFETPLIRVRRVFGSQFENNGQFRFKVPYENMHYYTLHDYRTDALKLIGLKHNSPPEYFVNALESILEYLITNKRDQEKNKIEMCIRKQEYLYNDITIVEKVVSISKVLKDENVDDRIKLYVLNSLQIILDEQEKLHKKMGITPQIIHIDRYV